MNGHGARSRTSRCLHRSGLAVVVSATLMVAWAAPAGAVTYGPPYDMAATQGAHYPGPPTPLHDGSHWEKADKSTGQLEAFAYAYNEIATPSSANRSDEASSAALATVVLIPGGGPHSVKAVLKPVFATEDMEWTPFVLWPLAGSEVSESHATLQLYLGGKLAATASAPLLRCQKNDGDGAVHCSPSQPMNPTVLSVTTAESGSALVSVELQSTARWTVSKVTLPPTLRRPFPRSAWIPPDQRFLTNDRTISD